MFLTISGMVIPPLKLENLPYQIGDLNVKSNHVNLGYLYKGEAGTESLVIANYTQNPIEISFKNVLPYISLLADPPTLKPGEYGQIQVEYYTEKIDDWDIVIDQVPVLLNGKEDSRVKLTITANIREDFRNLTEEQLTIAPVADFGNDSFNYDTISSDTSLSF
jgi:hypothetical protein